MKDRKLTNLQTCGDSLMKRSEIYRMNRMLAIMRNGSVVTDTFRNKQNKRYKGAPVVIEKDGFLYHFCHHIWPVVYYHNGRRYKTKRTKETCYYSQVCMTPKSYKRYKEEEKTRNAWIDDLAKKAKGGLTIKWRM